MKNTVASTAVVRDRKFALPLAPKRLPEEPLPKGAPMSAPLPCCTRMSPIMAIAVSICTARTIVSNTFISSSPNNFVRLPRGGRDDLQKVGWLQGRPPEQAAVDVGLRQQRGRVRRIHAAAVEDVHPLRVGTCGLQLRTQER